MSSGNARGVSSSGKKKGGGFLARQAKAKTDKKPPLTEEEVLAKGFATADDVLRLVKITESEYAFVMLRLEVKHDLNDFCSF